MRRYLFLIAYEPGGWESATPEERQVYVDGHEAFHRFVDARGRRISGAPLADADTATTVRHTRVTQHGDAPADTHADAQAVERADARPGEGARGRVVVSDGPFAESAEMIGGYYDVELPDLDSAIAAASLLPPAYAVEIRSVVELDARGERVG
ncbi:YciI family protein [Knoellia subterranea]|uniref:YCII-related domain-containing protein n=1 Tax=Knoellia subterranea KCTC 19937 TaxID=1385521 RepID=A0A0A0JHE6_9MICO|nr:YciI family protein [Knoellia subterranea]KGN36179.1 hypothetical protein N803_04785 [Knoellia subterranea KCTC 19937]